MKIEKKKMVEQTITVGHKCDFCNKETGPNEKDIFGFSSSHQEWDSDSNESFEWHEVCSWSCFIVKLTQLYEENKQYLSFKVSGIPLWIIKQIMKK